MITRSTAEQARKPRGHGHERRAEIIEAAKTLFFDEGVESVTTRRLAERVGVSQTGLYVYFPNKEAILDAIRRETFIALTEVISGVAKDAPANIDLLRAIGRTYIGFAFTHPKEFQLTFKAGSTRKHSTAELDLSRPYAEQSPGIQCFLTFRRQIERLLEAGVLRPADPTVIAQTTWMVFQGVCLMLIDWPNFPWAEREALIEQSLEMVVKGLAA
ncbi:TetR/AcrR family transcriptional regulator [Flaviflagellibacter deserti]|uniref:TetR/AcrR family transcriptional regulator n=1 Tax=Flaviflagellibacter deserti TaxID=2267266 RepID=A0ABV9Z8B1_9HYPH